MDFMQESGYSGHISFFSNCLFWCMHANTNRQERAASKEVTGPDFFNTTLIKLWAICNHCSTVTPTC